MSNKLYFQEYYQKNKEKKKEYSRQYRFKNKNKVAEAQRQWRLKNTDKKRELDRQYKIKNSERVKANRKADYHKNRERYIQQALEWQRQNPGKVKAKNRKYELALKQRIPQWADLKAIEQFYINCPEGYEVDHIIPLQGKNISGLHVLNNLQYLLKSENCAKSNKFPYYNISTSTEGSQTGKPEDPPSPPAP